MLAMSDPAGIRAAARAIALAIARGRLAGNAASAMLAAVRLAMSSYQLTTLRRSWPSYGAQVEELKRGR
jgi:hypothetical protein